MPSPTRRLAACPSRPAACTRRSVNRRKRRSLTQDVLCRPAACTRRFVTCVNPPHTLARHASMSLPTRGLHAPLRQPPQRRSLTQAGRKPFPLPTRGLHTPPCQLRHATFANRRKRRSLCQGFSSSQTDVMATRFAVQNKPLKTARAAWTLARSDGWRKRMSTRGSLSTSAPK